MWDELAVFLGLFGSTRSDRAAYDRGILCELYSPTNYVRRQLVTRTNIMIKPRLNILAAGHPKETINCLTGNWILARQLASSLNFLLISPSHLTIELHLATRRYVSVHRRCRFQILGIQWWWPLQSISFCRGVSTYTYSGLSASVWFDSKIGSPFLFDAIIA